MPKTNWFFFAKRPSALKRLSFDEGVPSGDVGVPSGEVVATRLRIPPLARMACEGGTKHGLCRATSGRQGLTCGLHGCASSAQTMGRKRRATFGVYHIAREGMARPKERGGSRREGREILLAVS
eukprot:scaffold83_cov246-Pinguiococcus_pyrenoidosus.AAC.8